MKTMTRSAWSGVVILFLALGTVGQTTDYINYQAVARDGAGNLLANQWIDFRLSIIMGDPILGPVVYTELHHKMTNPFGLATMEIGNGVPLFGNYAAIEWAIAKYYLKTEIDILGTKQVFIHIGTSVLNATAIALAARTATSISITANAGQTLRHNGTTWVANSFLFNNNNRIGINTTNPQNTLDVNGIVAASGGFLLPDGTLMTKSGGTSYSNVYTVAQSGGDYTSITQALNACTSPAKNNTYLIRVMPGKYTETVACKKFVHLFGAGKYVVTIDGQVTGEDTAVIENFNITKGIQCIGKSPTIIHNIITNDEGDGIYISDQAKPWIKENEIRDCSGWGIHTIDFHTDPWIIANKIIANNSGGIKCDQTSPTISNNFIDYNHSYGIYVVGQIGTPAEPTIDDNVIGHTDYDMAGMGIFLTGFAEPRIMSNDIYVNGSGIEILGNTQPSIIGNDINYNKDAGIRCFSKGASKRVVITSNHIHSNTYLGAINGAGILIVNCNPMITQNNITQNDRTTPKTMPDIDYFPCVIPPANNLPMISLNSYDIINRSPAGTAGGNFNVDSNGNIIAP